MSGVTLVEAAWAENDQLRNDLAEKVQELEEANAVIDAVRSARLAIVAMVNNDDDPVRTEPLCRAVRLFDEVDGL